MRLKQIKLAGFKSFVDTTKIPFNHTMTAIVGPNGCGKSNIIDAVRWVLGESSAKNLRGDSMADVIFNGASNRKPISQASVELLFENIDNKVSLVIDKHDKKQKKNIFASRSQVSIRRLVNRDGTNQYFLNGSKCRRRDITDIFLGTGLGPRSYAIIEQGTISKLIESKPKELRVFIEEAAGISKYKERRKESENSIRHTRENLARLADIQSELNLQIDKLHQQSQAVERFKTLKAQERLLKAELNALRWQQCENKNNQLETKLSQHKIKINDLLLQQNQQDIQMLSYKGKISLDSEKLASLQKKKLELTQNIVRAEQAVKFTKEQKDQLDKEVAKVSQKLVQIKEAILESIQQQNIENEKLSEISPKLELKVKNISELQKELDLMMHSQENWQSDWLQYQQQQTKEILRIEQYKTLKSDVDRQHKLLNEKQVRKDVVENKIHLLVEEQKDSAEFESYEKLSYLLQQVDIQQNVNKNIQVELVKLQSLLVSNQQEIATKEGIQQGISNQIEQLNQLVNTKDDWQKEQSLWLKERSIMTKGLLHHQINIESKWQAALEQVLSVWLQAPILEKIPNEILLDTALFIENKTKITPLIKELKVTGTLAEVAHGCEMFYLQLSKIFLAENQEEAQLLLINLKDDESVVCPDTTWLSHYFIRKGSTESFPHILQQTCQLSQLTEQLIEVKNKQKKIFDANKKLSAKITTLQNELLSNKKILTEFEQKYQKNKQSNAFKQQQKNNAFKQEKTLQLELNVLLCEIVEERKVLQQIIDQKNVIKITSNDSVDNDAIGKQLHNQQDFYQQNIKTLQDKLQLSHREHHSLVITVEQAKNKQQQAESMIKQNKQQEIQLLEQQQEYNYKLNKFNIPLLLDNTQLDDWLQDMLLLDDEIQKNHYNQTSYSREIQNIEQEQTKLLRSLESNNAKVIEIKLSQERSNAYAQKYIEQLNELQTELTTILDNMPSNAKESLWQAKLIKLSEHIQQLGAINLAAIDEYEQQVARKLFLDQQSDDLFEALKTLETVIATINKESKLKFKTTFDQINQDLKILFPKVFGGGHAYLALTDDDLLETGVSIMARPPGKKNSTIHLLSGGEKALTALSLVFAIFRLNPAPFCLLDEVDAPLDDANVVRFCNLVQEMSQTVQFIYISHNKIAMEMATHLAGVTMFEAGVSKMVAVDIDEAIAMADLA